MSQEVFTPDQARLADLLLTAEIVIPVRRRIGTPENREFRDVVRVAHPIDFAQNDGEHVFKHFELRPEAPLPPVKINLRNLPHEIVLLIAQELVNVTGDWCADGVVGIPNAGGPIADAYAEMTGIPHVRLLEKVVSGSNRHVVTAPGVDFIGSLIVIDDCLSQGLSTLEATGVIGLHGNPIVGAVDFIDREEGGRERIDRTGLVSRSAFKLSQFYDYYLASRQITEEQYAAVTAYQQMAYLESQQQYHYASP